MVSVSIWQDEGDGRPRDYEVAVIGAGIAGAYAAWRLGRAGQAVALLEARYVAAGASGRNAGMVLRGTAENYARGVERYGRAVARAAWELSAESQCLVRALADRFGLPVTSGGSLLLTTAAREAVDLRRSAMLLAEDGFVADYIDHDPLSRGFRAGLAQPEDFGLDPAALVRALVADSGADLIEGCPVWSLAADGAGVLVRGRRAVVRAGRAIVATNAEAPRLHRHFAGLVTPRRAQMLATAPLPPLLGPLVYADEGYEYIRQRADGRVLLGGGRRRHGASEVGYDLAPTAPVQAELAAFLARHFPEAAAAPVERRWAGTMGFSPDGLPLVGRLPELPAVSYAVGFTGHGLSLGPAVVERLLDWLAGRPLPDWLASERLAAMRRRTAGAGAPAMG